MGGATTPEIVILVSWRNAQNWEKQWAIKGGPKVREEKL